MEKLIDRPVLTEPQKRAYEKLGYKWVKAPTIEEYYCVLYELHKKGLVDLKMTKYNILWRKRWLNK